MSIQIQPADRSDRDAANSMGLRPASSSAAKYSIVVDRKPWPGRQATHQQLYCHWAGAVFQSLFFAAQHTQLSAIILLFSR